MVVTECLLFAEKKVVAGAGRRSELLSAFIIVPRNSIKYLLCANRVVFSQKYKKLKRTQSCCVFTNIKCEHVCSIVLRLTPIKCVDGSCPTDRKTIINVNSVYRYLPWLNLTSNYRYSLPYKRLDIGSLLRHDP